MTDDESHPGDGGPGRADSPEDWTGKTKTVDYRMCGPNILFATTRPDTQQTAEDARENLALVREVAGSGRIQMITDVRRTGTLSKEARDCFTGEEGAQVVSAAAFIVDSSFSRALGNIFARDAKASFPVTLVTSEEEAIAWLESLG